MAPSRVELGLSDALSALERSNIGGQFWQSNTFLLQVQHRWDAMGYAWTKWVLNYNSDKQEGLFRRLLGGIDAWRIGLALLAVFISIVGLYMALFWFFNRRIEPLSVEAKLYLKYCKKLMRFQIQREINETPDQLSVRVSEKMPHAQKSALHIARLFNQITYAGRQELLPELKKAVNAFPSIHKA